MNESSRPSTGPEASAQGVLQVVGFRVADEDFAVDILEIVGIERLDAVRQLPKMPAFVEGVMRIRDEIVPLVKLRTRFGFAEAAHDEKARVLVVEIGDDTVGFIVDAVSAVRRFGSRQVEPAPPLALSDDSRFVRGVLRAGREMLVLLDPFALLHEEEKRLLRSAVDATERAGVA
ncbi:MAG: purine-binding chemotaxis protein CheW [Holophagales bacterium]|nr:purine-binding chemotaxis protein CheW [Holophagales bacterium]MBK9966402.1 purine-binding chemotaxis protein CheW [Holophagales bacterium]